MIGTIMGFPKGHEYYPAKGALPGIGKARTRRIRELGLAVQDRLPADVFVSYWIGIASGKSVRLHDDGEGEIVVVEDTDGITPTQEMRNEAMKWLADRGHGTPVQSIALRAHLERAGESSSPIHPDALAPGAAFELARAFQRIKELQAKPAAALPPVIDAESTETRDPVPAMDTPDAGAPGLAPIPPADNEE